MSSKKQRQRIAIRPSGDGGGNRTSSTASYKESCELLDLSSFNDVHMSEEESLVVVCQAKVTMEELVHYTIQEHQVIPKVVAEFRNITVGGAISGSALESTSHLYGQLMDTVTWVKVRTGSGEIVKAQRGDSLWCSLSGTYGSMGIVLEAALECIPASPFVRVSYYAFEHVTKGIEAIFETLSDSNHIFLDGLIFPPQQITYSESALQHQRATVVMRGQMLEKFGEIPSTSKVGWKCKLHGGSFYYEHVRSLLNDHFQKSNQQQSSVVNPPFFEEIISLEDYLFRYDYGAFWMARPMAFEISNILSYLPFVIGLFVASCRWMRVLTGSMFTAKNLFRLLKMAPEAVVSKKMVVQDCYIPQRSVVSFLTWVQASIPLSTPIWLCPVRSNNNQPFTPSFRDGESTELLLNCGIYGRVCNGRGSRYTQQLEAKCQVAGGRKMLYAQNHYDQKQFWEIMNKPQYERLRQEHAAADAFPSLYEKTCGVPSPQNTWKEAILSLFF